ncbi:MAG: hypothetical protein AB1384_10245 [Actinomycetota bacterium]
MRAGCQRFVLTAVCAVLVLAVSALAGCGDAPGDDSAAVTEATTTFLNALGDRDVELLRSLMSQDYLESSGVPDPISSEQLVAALGYMNSYRFIPEEDITIEGDRAVITVDIELAQKGEREETMALVREDGTWKVDAFTALDWSKKPVVMEENTDEVEAEQALRDFLIACIDGDTDFIFEHLSPAYKEKRHLDEPWTPAEFSGIFGTARSFDFNAEDLKVEDGSVEIDVTVEFGTRGNLESETARVGLVKEGSAWLIETFPFFIY